MEGSFRPCTKNKRERNPIKFIACLFLLSLILVAFHIQSFPSDSSLTSLSFFDQWKRGGGATDHSRIVNAMIVKLKDSVTFLPLKDLRFSKTAMTGNTWFMNSLNDTREENEAEYLYFPSEASKGRLLCLKGGDSEDGTKNSYALAWRESLPDNATLLEGLTFVSDTYFNYQNLWHGVCAAAPFVRWSMKNECVRPTRWVLYHWGELRFKMGTWLEHLMQAYFGDVNVEGFNQGDGSYCFEKAVVMRHDVAGMGDENKLKVFDLLRCKARKFCGLNQTRRTREVNERGAPIIRFTLLLRRGSRSFKNVTAVVRIFSRVCTSVEGCIFNVVDSEDLSFCDQVRVMSNTDIVASPHGAQLTNMFFMDREGSVMEFFPKGWLEHAGIGQYAHQWMANQSGMKHRGAWWDPVGEDCPNPKDDPECFTFHKDGQVGHNATYFSKWGMEVLEQVRLSKTQEATKNLAEEIHLNSDACLC